MEDPGECLGEGVSRERNEGGFISRARKRNEEKKLHEFALKPERCYVDDIDGYLLKLRYPVFLMS